MQSDTNGRTRAASPGLLAINSTRELRTLNLLDTVQTTNFPYTPLTAIKSFLDPAPNLSLRKGVEERVKTSSPLPDRTFERASPKIFVLNPFDDPIEQPDPISEEETPPPEQVAEELPAEEVYKECADVEEVLISEGDAYG